MGDSGRYDYTGEEVQRLVLGLLTASNISTPTALAYWGETFADDPTPLDDLPSALRLNGQVIGMLATIVNAFRNEPVTRPYVERILDGLRDGTMF